MSEAADAPVLLLLTVALVSPTLLRNTPSPVRNSPKYGVFRNSKNMISTCSFCLYFVFQFENNMTYYMCYHIFTAIFVIIRTSPDLPYD